jgi:hypothetical protein
MTSIQTNSGHKNMDDREAVDRLARIETRMESVTDTLESLVSRAEFLPVKLIAYGVAGGVLTAFLAAVIQVVVK